MKSRWGALYSTKGTGDRTLRSPLRRLVGLLAPSVRGGFAVGLSAMAYGQVPQTLNGPPVQVQPYVAEPGVPLFTINPGTVNPFSEVDGWGTGAQTGSDNSGGGDGTGAGGGTSADSTGGGYSNGVGAVGNSTVLGTMLAQARGATAVGNAEALGVNPSALAATCVLERACQNVGGSGAQGAFQMYPAVFNEGLQTALAAIPSLASQVVQGTAGRMDPATEAIAASGYLIQATQSLQSAGIADPTVLQVRGYYNFGPAYGAELAEASDNEPIANVLYGMSQSALAQNGIVPGETVGQWRATVSSKIGNAANQSVVTS
jgi:hypothetical protein